MTLNGCNRKIQSILGSFASAVPHKYDAVLGGARKKFPFTVTPPCCSESCPAEMRAWPPPVGVYRDWVVLVLLLHWALGSAEWAEGQKHSKGDDPWASCHTSNTSREKFSWNSILLVLLNGEHCIDTDNQWHFHICGWASAWLDVFCIQVHGQCQWAIKVIIYDVCKWLCYEISQVLSKRRSEVVSQGWEEIVRCIMYRCEKVSLHKLTQVWLDGCWLPHAVFSTHLTVL